MRTPDSADERQREPRGPSSDAGPPAPGTKDAARHSAPLPTPQAESRSAPPPTAQTARHARFAVFGFVSRPAYPGVCPEAPGDLRLPAARETPGTPALFNFPVGLFQSSNSHTVRASSIRLRPPQLSTNSWIKLSSDELNRLPLKFAPLVPISLLATTTVANAGTNVQQKVTPLRVHNQSKFRYPLTNLTTSDRWTVRSLRKWAILAVPKEPHPNALMACPNRSSGRPMTAASRSRPV